MIFKSKSFSAGFLIFTVISSTVYGQCVGRMVNPATDICWECIFPLKIMGNTISSGGPEPEGTSDPICVCSRPPLPVPVPGAPVSFWEPVRLVDVTRTPFCLVNMGGVSDSNMGIKGRGDVEYNADGFTKHSFYHVHWYVYPIIFWAELLIDIVCLESSGFDLAHLTELDPFWADDAKSSILNPEGILFGNPVAQAACAADGVAATANLPLDPLFWCAGAWGSMYPFTGTVNDHEGGVQASSLLVARMMAKLHRELLLWGTVGIRGLCGRYPMPIIKKSQYRLQMTYPIPQTDGCHPIGKIPVTFQAGKEYPYKGEDYGYLVWRKRDCCLL